MLKLTSAVMALTLTSAHAMWVPEKRQEPEKTTAAKPTTTTTKKAATSEKKESTQKKESTKKESSTKASSSKPKSTHKSELSNTLLPTTDTLLPTSSMSSSTGLPSSSSASAESSSGSSSAGIIGGIIAAVAVLIIGVGAFFVIRKKKARRNLRAQSMKPDPFTMGYGNNDPKPLNDNFPPAQAYKNQASSFDNYEVAPITNTITNQQYQPQLSPAPPVIATIPQHKSIGSFTVIATYIPTLSDELEIETGDQIDLIVEYDDGWCQGVNISKGHTKGVFPRHCIDYATAPSNHANAEIERSKRVSSMYQP